LAPDDAAISTLEAVHAVLIEDIKTTRFRQAVIVFVLMGMAAVTFSLCNYGYLVGILWGCLLCFLLALCALTLQQRKNTAKELTELILDEIKQLKE
jgi:SNF family Na+-dependent transporter